MMAPMDGTAFPAILALLTALCMALCQPLRFSNMAVSFGTVALEVIHIMATIIINSSDIAIELLSHLIPSAIKQQLDSLLMGIFLLAATIIAISFLRYQPDRFPSDPSDRKKLVPVSRRSRPKPASKKASIGATLQPTQPTQEKVPETLPKRDAEVASADR